MTLKQLCFELPDDTVHPSSPHVNEATEQLAERGGLEARGAVFTRLEVVDFILDLAGYTVDQPLHKKRLLEPSFGGGDFLFAAVHRLLTAWRAAHGPVGSALQDLGDAIRAVELHYETFDATHGALVALLQREGLPAETATALANRWLVQGDYLLIPLKGLFDFVVGNPPYVRQELIPAPLLAEYRSRYRTIYDRADLYVPFIERSLSLLSIRGSLGFICADRWMKNRYGGPLRSLVAQDFHLKIYVDMTDTPAFHSDVIAYPAITIISREPPGGYPLCQSSDDRPHLFGDPGQRAEGDIFGQGCCVRARIGASTQRLGTVAARVTGSNGSDSSPRAAISYIGRSGL